LAVSRARETRHRRPSAQAPLPRRPRWLPPSSRRRDLRIWFFVIRHHCLPSEVQVESVRTARTCSRACATGSARVASTCRQATRSASRLDRTFAVSSFMTMTRYRKNVDRRTHVHLAVHENLAISHRRHRADERSRSRPGSDCPKSTGMLI
jgi:hypothetical protein